MASGTSTTRHRPKSTTARSRQGNRGRTAATPAAPEAAATPAGRRDPLLATICHDLRAPLAAVTMGANFVLQTLRDDEHGARSRRILEAMLRSCAQMERLVRNFADLSEIESGGVTLRIGTHDAGEMLDLAAQATRDVAATRSVTVEVDKPVESVVFDADRERLLRALEHVIENAANSAPEGSTVTVTVAARGAQVVFGVVDRGPGLDAETRKNLFDREWHAKHANRAGAGFGLAIARGFARAHGGDITVDSRPGTTTFSIAVPKRSAEVSAANSPRR